MTECRRRNACPRLVIIAVVSYVVTLLIAPPSSADSRRTQGVRAHGVLGTAPTAAPTVVPTPGAIAISPLTSPGGTPQDDTAHLNTAIQQAAALVAGSTSGPGIHVPGSTPGEPPANLGPNAPQGVVYMGPGTYYLMPSGVVGSNAPTVNFVSNVRLEVDAGAVLRQLPGNFPPGSGMSLLTWGVGNSGITNVTLIGVGTGSTTKVPNVAAPPGFPGWSVDEYFTIDLLQAQGYQPNQKTSGMAAENVTHLWVANVFSMQTGTDPTDAVTGPNSQRAILDLRDTPQSKLGGPYFDPTFGTIENWYNVGSPAGYGPNQVNGGHNLLLRNIFSEGGTALRFETDASKKGNFAGQVMNVTAQFIGAWGCNRAVSFSPHSQVNLDIDVSDVWAQNCYQGVVESVSKGKPGQFQSTTISDVTVIGGPATAPSGCSPVAGIPPAQVDLSGGGGWVCGQSFQAFGYQGPGVSPPWRILYTEGTFSCSGTFTGNNDKILVALTAGSTQTVRPTCG